MLRAHQAFRPFWNEAEIKLTVHLQVKSYTFSGIQPSMVTLRNAPAVQTTGVPFPTGTSEGNSRVLTGKCLHLEVKSSGKLILLSQVFHQRDGGGRAAWQLQVLPWSEVRRLGPHTLLSTLAHSALLWSSPATLVHSRRQLRPPPLKAAVLFLIDSLLSKSSRLKLLER